MLDKTQVTKLAVAGFGAAMASVYAIPEAHATIIPISFNPDSVKFSIASSLVSFKTASNNNILGMLVRNDASEKKLFLTTYASLAVKSVGQTISAGQFRGTHNLGESPNAAGTAYIGFRSNTGGAGWFAVNWGGTGGAITFLKGAYNFAEGGSIVVGQMAVGVPEPSEIGLFTLGLLALGAAGVRLRREARKAAELN